MLRLIGRTMASLLVDESLVNRMELLTFADASPEHQPSIAMAVTTVLSEFKSLGIWTMTAINTASQQVPVS